MNNLKLLDDKRIRIFTGHFGSGKTEVAVNYTVMLKKVLSSEPGLNVGIADLDVVNPYFRSRERASMLRGLGIRVVGSSLDLPHVDVPAVSAEVNTFIEDHQWLAVLDAGGDSEGVRVLGRFSGKIAPDDYDMFLVLNARRPETRRVEQVLELIKKLEASSRMKITGLINNTHLLKDTACEDVLAGDRLARGVTEKTGIKLRYTAAIKTVAEDCAGNFKGMIFPLDLYMRDEWMS